ncbi:MAG TPA: DUF3089 domain-containing protein [Negativicutes bacterium]|nr:DUF3089 domain-containing protein [Negativicutes bacterium]
MNTKKIALVVLVLIFSLNFVVYGSEISVTDYANPEYWLSLPVSTEKTVDVFYLYPTVFQKVDKNEPNVCDIDNPVMLKNSKLALAFQASAFEPVGNLFAPYYRQADAAYTLALPLAEQGKVIGGIPTADAVAAFDYYIQNYNQGRPFILAGHSQGSNVLLYLLSGYMKEHPKVQERMIAAYVIGYSVTPEYLAKNPHLKFAKGSQDTGVIISYNTEAPKMEGKSPVVLPGALVINPISWTRGEKTATAAENLGSVDMDATGKMVTLQHYADARVSKERGVVICSTVDVNKLSPGNQVFPKGVYHHYDYLFYYYNLRENAATRTENFLNK